MKIVYLTAGAAGMYCGSCMHDNALAKALTNRGAECLLQPVYTPIRTDETSVADERVFLGGIHVYLLQRFPALKYLPRFLRGILDYPPLIRWATRRVGSTDAAVLGDLSVSMLKGKHGNQAAEFERLCDWIADEIQPDAVILTNLLIGGGLPQLRERLPNAKLVVMLQGDDIFLDHLSEKHRTEAIQLCGGLVEHVDHFCVHSQFYRAKMRDLLGIPDAKFVQTPLSIDLSAFENAKPMDEDDRQREPFRLGFFARIAPEKGLHRLVDAFTKLASVDESIRLDVAGWLGAANEPYLAELEKKIAGSGLQDRFSYHGSPDLDAKVEFLRHVDLLCVPTEYEDPKGLFILEALAAGTPVVMPDHGAFGELIRSIDGGVLVAPGETDALCAAILDLKTNALKLAELAKTGNANVRRNHSIDAAAQQLMEMIGSAD